MKKYLIFLIAVAALLFASGCVKETDKDTGDTVEVTFDLQLDGVSSTKAFADGGSANELYVGVYDANTGEFYRRVSITKRAITKKKASYTAHLIKGRSYKLAFFAQKANNGLYTVDLENKTVVANYDANVLCNDDAYDCFYHLESLKNVKEPLTKTVKLTRPLAQINLLTSDDDVSLARLLGYSLGTSSMTVKKVKNTLNLDDGTLSGDEVPVSFAASECKGSSFLKGYKYVAMAYVLAEGGSNSTKTVELTVDLNGSDDQSKSYDYTVEMVPIRRNYRTNIIGSVFSADALFTVSCDTEFEGSSDAEVILATRRPEFDPAGGTEEQPVEVPLNTQVTLTSEEDASIWYTTNGDDPSDPNVTSTLYVGPIAITQAVTIKAYATKPDKYDSDVVVASYAIQAGGGGTETPAEVGTVLWSETWTGGAANDTPYSYGQEGTTIYNNGTVSYTYTDGGSATKLYNSNDMDGSTPQLNLLLGKNTGTWTITGIPSGSAKKATLTYYVNNKSSIATKCAVTTTTAGVTMGTQTVGAETAKPFSVTYELSFENVGTFDLTFSNTNSSNVRLDDISVVVTEAGEIPDPAVSVDEEPEGMGNEVSGIVAQIPTTANKAAAAVAYTATLDGAVVTYVNGSNAYIEDKSGAILLFKSKHGLNPGDIITGAISGTGYWYNGLPEITDLGTACTITTGGTKIRQTAMTLAALLEDYDANLNRRIRIKGVTISDGIADGDRNGEIQVGEDKLAVYSQLKNKGLVLTKDEEGDLICFPSYFNTTKQVSFWDNSHFTKAATEEKAPITIDGSLTDWAEAEGVVTFAGINDRIKEWKFVSDATNLYFYYKMTKSKIKSNGSSSFYVGFNLDNDTATGSQAEHGAAGNSAGLEALAYFYPWVSTTEVKAAGADDTSYVQMLDPEGEKQNGVITLGGMMDSDYAYVEICIPRSTIGSPKSGAKITVKHAVQYYPTTAEQITLK